MNRKLMLILAGLLTMIFVTGCQPKEKNPADSPKEDTGNVVNNGTTDEDTDKEDAEKEDVSEEDAGQVSQVTYPYTYIDAAQREVVIEKEPLRIAVSYLPLWETLYMLGVNPVAANGADNYRATWDPFIGLDMEDVVDLGTQEINLELLLEVEPDLFLMQAQDPATADTTNYEMISQVAVFGNDTRLNWKESVRQVGELIGRSDRADEILREYDEMLEDFRNKLQDKYQGETVLQISVMGSDRYFYAYRPMLYDKEEGLGLTAPEGYTSSENFEQISIEAIAGMNPDYIFVNVFDGDEPLLAEIEQNELWKALKAVKEGNVTRLDGAGHSSSGMSIQYTLNMIVDKLLAD